MHRAQNERMRLFLALVFLGCCWAQPNIPAPGPYSTIKEFLSLNDSQYQTLLSNNAVNSDTLSNKQTQIFQLQLEIRAETGKPTPDPMALGIRYLQIENLCRDISRQSSAIVKMKTDMLTDAQKAKLKTLDDAAKLAPVISLAQNANLLPPSPQGLTIYDPLTVVPVIRTGDFTSLITPANGCATLNGSFSQLISPAQKPVTPQSPAL